MYLGRLWTYQQPAWCIFVQTLGFWSKIFVVHNVVSEGVGVCGWQQGGPDPGHLKQEPQTHPEQKHLQPVGYKTSYL